MFISQTIIAIVFRLINFFIFIGLAIYAFKKYAMPTISILMAKKRAEKEFLLSQQISFEKKQHELDELIKKETALCESLKIKINEWRRIAERDCQDKAKERIEQAVRVEKKNYKRAELRERARVQEVVLTTVVSDLSESLPHHFQKESVGNEYINSILQFMDERES